MPSFPVLGAELTDGVVSLRLAEERDIPEVLIAYQDDPALHEALGEERPPSGAALGRRSEGAEDDRQTGRAITLTILQAGSDECRGEVRVSGADWQSGRAAVRVWVAPGLRGRGLGRRAHELAQGWLSGSCGLDARCERVEGG